jgi:ADP-ribose pyrophosphatase YjhB (NUDIX family)
MSVHRLVERVKAIAQSGLAYTLGAYDRERYAQLAQIAEDLAVGLTGRPADEVRAHWIAEQGYGTPKVGVRAAVIRDGTILLCKEALDGRWSLPGGWADVGESPADNAVKETREESGYLVRAIKLVACFDHDHPRHGHPETLTHSYELFFLCALEGGEARPSLETTEVGFFAPDALPPLSLQRVTPQQVAMCFRHHADPSLPTEFD